MANQQSASSEKQIGNDTNPRKKRQKNQVVEASNPQDLPGTQLEGKLSADGDESKGAKRPNRENGRKQPQPMSEAVRPTVRKFGPRLRHVGLFLSFFILVILPGFAVYWYLTERAVEQYSSDVGFTVRKEEASTALDILGGITNLSSAASSDSDILYKFILSRELLEKVDQRLDLRGIYSAHYTTDPIFSLRKNASVEELLAYWLRMVKVSYTPGTGLMEIRTLAFTPQDAKLIAETIFFESSTMINNLSAVARDDSIQYAKAELENAQNELKATRQAITKIRSQNQIVDVESDIQVRMGLIGSLQQQLAEELINFDMLKSTSRQGDPRLRQSERRIEIIRERISAERKRFGAGTESTNSSDSDPGYASVVSEFEKLSIEREFAEKMYDAALSNFHQAQAEAYRQSRYLAAFIQPTLAQTSEYPRTGIIFSLTIMFLFVCWAILALVFYSLRDRR